MNSEKLTDYNINETNITLFNNKNIQSYIQTYTYDNTISNTTVNGSYLISLNEKFNWGVFNLYMVKCNFYIQKDLSDNISYYNISEQGSRLDPTCMFPASKTSVNDSCNWIYLTSRNIDNGNGLRFILDCYDESNNILNIDINKLKTYVEVKIYPII